MTENSTGILSIDLMESKYVYLEFYHPKHPAVLDSPYDGENPIFRVTNKFDYEIDENDHQLLYIDIGVSFVPHLGAEIRSEFFVSRSATWDDVFIYSTLRPVVEEACEECFEAVFDQLKEHHIEYDENEFKLTPENIDYATNAIVNNYVNIRKADDLYNAKLDNDIKLTFTPGEYTSYILNGAFIVIEQILYRDTNFNLYHNRAVFETYYPMARYISFRSIIAGSKDKNLTLSGVNLVFIIKYTEMAVNLLLGKHADTLIAGLNKTDFGPESQKKYFKYVTEFLKYINDMLQKNDFQIVGLHDDIDWDSVIRQQ